MGNRIHTDFLTATPGFLTGMASAMALAGNFYGFNQAKGPAAADRRSLRADWVMVGQDLADVMKQAQSHPECLKKPV